MSSSSNTLHPAEVEPSCYFGSTLFWLRWSILAALLLLTVVQSIEGRIGLPLWALVLVFAGYNLLAELFQSRLSRFRPAPWVSLLDLPMASLVYFLGSTPDGPLFVLFLLIVGCAATCMTLRGNVLYTALVVIIVLVIAPTLPRWEPEADNILRLGMQLIVLGLIGVGTSLLMQHLVREREAAQLGRDEAARWEELNRLRTRFVSTISHDLQTPITAIKAAVGMLIPHVQDRLTTDEHELLVGALRNTNRLSMLINDLLAYNQIEAGVLRIEREPLDLRAIVMQPLSAVHPLIQEKHQIVEVDLSEPLPYCGDRHRLEQVVVNLLSNANQHTPESTRITIAGKCIHSDIHLAVCDNGPGIPQEELEVIFQRFHRLTSSNGGSGLGLAIAKNIIELHGGRVWAESEPGQGATFHVVLPDMTKESRT